MSALERIATAASNPPVPVESTWLSVDPGPRRIDLEPGRYAWDPYPFSLAGKSPMAPEPVTERQMAERARDHLYT